MVFEKRYENGLRLVVKKMDGFMSVAMGILIGTGAYAETDKEDWYFSYSRPTLKDLFTVK